MAKTANVLGWHGYSLIACRVVATGILGLLIFWIFEGTKGTPDWVVGTTSIVWLLLVFLSSTFYLLEE